MTQTALLKAVLKDFGITKRRRKPMPNTTKAVTHTPGDWRRRGSQIIAPNGKIVGEAFSLGSEDAEQTIPNANLMCAAPDGLAVAQNALNWWHSVPSHFLAKEPAWVQDARDFIRKAQGGEPNA